MALLAFADELDMVDLVSAPSLASHNGLYDADFARAGMRFDGAALGNILLDTPSTDCWVSMQYANAEAFAGAPPSDQTVWSVQGTDISFVATPSDTFELRSTSLFTWTVPTTPAVREKIDLRITIGVNGRIELYHKGNLVDFYAGDTTSIGTNVLGLQVAAYFPGAITGFKWADYSEVMIADTETVGSRLETIAPASDGTLGEWAGDRTDVDEITVDDADVITSNTTGQRETFIGSSRSVAAQALFPQTVYNVGRARAAGGTTLELEGALEIATGLDYRTPNSTLFAGFTTNITEWLDNNGADWLSADLDGIEFGYRSITAP
jgi:hypothetical protein